MDVTSRMNNMPRSSKMPVRGAWLVLVMLLSSMAPFASADSSTPIIYYGAPLKESAEESPLTYSFSPAIRAAFTRVSDISQYTSAELESTTEWVVVSSTPMGEATGILANTWIIEVEPSDALQHFSQLQDSGLIETAYPLVERQMIPRWTPNDTYFSNQWHLENTGQDNGVAGEDVNITGAWNDVLGTGIVIGIVDDLPESGLSYAAGVFGDIRWFLFFIDFLFF